MSAGYAEEGSGQDSFTAFVATRASALARTAYVLTGNSHDAEDLVQTALYKAAKVWKRIEHHPEPYVRRILYNESISRWRHRRHALMRLRELSPELADFGSLRDDSLAGPLS